MILEYIREEHNVRKIIRHIGLTVLWFASAALAGTGTMIWYIYRPLPQVSLPRLQGMNQNNAIKSLKDLGIRDIKIEKEPTTSIAKNSVISSDPIAGSTALKSGEVTLKISEGNIGKMKNYVGQSASEVKEELEGMIGLSRKQLKLESISGTNQSLNTVIRQSYAGPSFDYSAQTLKLYVADGSRSIKISDYANQDFNQVKEKLLSEGIPDRNISVTYVTSNVVETGKIIDNTNVNELFLTTSNEPIKFNVSQGSQIKTVKMPSLIGLSKDEAISKLENLDFNTEMISFAGLDKTNVTAQSINQDTLVIPEQTYLSLLLESPTVYSKPVDQIDSSTLVGVNYNDVINKLKSLGIDYTIKLKKVSDRDQEGYVISANANQKEDGFELEVGQLVQ